MRLGGLSAGNTSEQTQGKYYEQSYNHYFLHHFTPVEIF